MIADIQDPFEKDGLAHKIDYQIKKIENGFAMELYNSIGDTIYNVYHNMTLVEELNDRVKLPYIEFTLNSPIGEEISNDKFSEIAKEYMESMGYGNTCYSIIKNNDKNHKHVHILATTIDLDGNHIPDSQNYAQSNKITRELEKKHGLQIMEKGKTSQRKSLGELQYRQYFFDTALHKALRSHNANERVNNILMQSETYKMINPDLTKPYTNTEWKVMLGEEIYEKMMNVLSDSKFFNSLYKDELLSVMDRLYQESNNAQEFKKKMTNEGYYMRLVSTKGKSHWNYGIPERSFYVKDTSLPVRYRFGQMNFVGRMMASDEQKHYLYNKIFTVLKKSSSYENFKDQLVNSQISLTEHENKVGIYGLSFSMANVESPEIFKSSDISKRLTYKNIQDYYMKENEHEVTIDKEIHVMAGTPIEPIIVCYINTRKEWEGDLTYMSPATMMLSAIPLEGQSKKRRKDDELLIKKKRKNKGLSI